tara:strand:- start:695 stop:1435 length:741 start_codon:yes stop_codon:yes gene_type:complete
MAVNIDKVYQRVLAITNKEQRGSVTPQDFNLLANQAQMNIFEQYFYDIKQFSRVPGVQTEFSDPLHILEEKLAPFRVNDESLPESTHVLNSNVYRLGEVSFFEFVVTDPLDPTVGYYLRPIQLGELTYSEMKLYDLSPLTRPTKTRPSYTRSEEFLIDILPAGLEDKGVVRYNYIKKPTNASWGYSVILGKALYSGTHSVDFQLHASEETSLVNEILVMLGIAIQRPDVAQAAIADEIKKNQSEKS